jgi:hypothetical protein
MIGNESRGCDFGGAIEYDMSPKREDMKRKTAQSPEAAGHDESHDIWESIERESKAESRKVKLANRKARLAREFPYVPESAEGPAYEEGARHRIIGGNMEGRDIRELTREFKAVSGQRPDIADPVYRLSVSAAPSDKVSTAQWQEIGEHLTNGLRLENCPWVMIQHRDTQLGEAPHDGVHLTWSRIDLNGKVASLWQSKMRVEQLLREIEIKYGFKQVKSSHAAERRGVTRSELALIDKTGQLSVKLHLQTHIDAALETLPTMTQFVNRLREDRINVVPNLQSSGHITGLSYEFDGKAMKASALGKAYTLNELEKRGLKYDPIREGQTVAEASERSCVRREQVQGPAGRSSGENRLATNSTQPSSDARADASPDRPGIRERSDPEEIRDRCVGSAPREEDGKVGARDAEQFYRNWQADGRDDFPPSSREQSPAQASDTYAGESTTGADQPFGCETIVDEQFNESITTPTINPNTASFGAVSMDRGEGASNSALYGDHNAGLPATTARGSRDRELGRVAK